MTAVLFSVIRIAVAVYIGLCLVVVIKQGRYVYYPKRDIATTPAYIGLAFDELRLRTTDGETISAWCVPAEEDTRRTVVFCHGNACNIGDLVYTAEWLRGMGWNVLLFDYRGYGESTGKPDEEGTYRDIQAAWDYLMAERGLPAKDVVLFGRSLGGAVATWLAAKEEVAGLVLESTFSSGPDMAHTMFPFLPARLLCRFKYDTESRVGSVGCPVMVAHSPEDATIPFAQGQAVFDAAAGPKEFVRLGGGHNDGGFEGSADARERLRAFLDRCVPAERETEPVRTAE